MHLKKYLLVSLSLVLLVALGISGYYYLQKDVSIVIDGHNYTVHTFKGNVKEVLDEARVPVYDKDVVSPALNAAIFDKSKIVITRAIDVNVVADGKRTTIRTVPVTVNEVLKMAGISLGKLDYTSKPLQARVAALDNIKVTRVKQVFVKRQVKLDFTEERRPDPTLEKGITRLIRKGSPGLAEKTICITYEDGKEVSRAVSASKVIKEPKSHLIAMGSLSSVSRGGRDIHFERAVVVEATAYSHTGYRTATGVYPEVGTVAVDPRVIPLGSKLYVEGYGYARAQDTGGAIIGNRIDVFMDTDSAARRWGRRTVKVYIID